MGQGLLVGGSWGCFVGMALIALCALQVKAEQARMEREVHQAMAAQERQHGRILRSASSVRLGIDASRADEQDSEGGLAETLKVRSSSPGVLSLHARRLQMGGRGRTFYVAARLVTSAAAPHRETWPDSQCPSAAAAFLQVAVGTEGHLQMTDTRRPALPAPHCLCRSIWCLPLQAIVGCQGPTPKYVRFHEYHLQRYLSRLGAYPPK